MVFDEVPDIYRINPKKLSIDRTMAGRIIQVGLPTAIPNTVISFQMYWYNLVSMDSEPVQWRVLVHT